MLTIFTVPKAFDGHIGVIQRNAIRSWLALRPACDVILFGDDRGTAEAAAELRVQHVPQLVRNEYGTPLLNGLFSAAQRLSRHHWLCYVNCDIILMSDFMDAVTRVAGRLSEGLMICRRWDLGVDGPLDFDDGWQQRIRSEVAGRGRRRPHTAIDCFVFSRRLWNEIPPFALGRGMWDNWLIFAARSKRWAVVDLSDVVLMVHQNHDYAHQAHGIRTEADVWSTVEAERNRRLGGGRAHAFSAYDATHVLTWRGLKRNVTPYSVYRSLALLSVSRPLVATLLVGLRRLDARFRTLRRALLWRVRL